MFNLVKMNNRIKALIAFALILAIVIIPVGAQQPLTEIPSVGRIVIEDMELWEDEGKTIPYIGPLDWGELRPGENGTEILYVENVGNVNSTLNLWSGNWSSPEAEQYLMLTWDFSGEHLVVGEIRLVTLILVVHPDIEIVKDFHFDIGLSIQNIESYP